MSPQIFGDHDQRAKVARALLSVSTQSNFSADGLIVYLDTIDYSACAHIRNDFRVPAFFWHQGNAVDRVPDSLLPLMQTNPAIIWLSKSLLESTTARLIWVYAHEFRHFMQWREFVDLNPLQIFLAKLHSKEGFSGQGTQLEIAAELDSELFAKRTVKAVIGEEAFATYLGECQSDPKGNAYFRRFAELEALLQNQIAG